MPNADTSAAIHFHNLTKYMRDRGTDGEFRSWMGEPPNEGPSMGEQSPSNEPLPYKIYTDLEPIELPREFQEAPVPGLAAIASTGGGTYQRNVAGTRGRCSTRKASDAPLKSLVPFC